MTNMKNTDLWRHIGHQCEIRCCGKSQDMVALVCLDCEDEEVIILDSGGDAI